MSPQHGYQRHGPDVWPDDLTDLTVSGSDVQFLGSSREVKIPIILTSGTPFTQNEVGKFFFDSRFAFYSDFGQRVFFVHFFIIIFVIHIQTFPFSADFHSGKLFAKALFKYFCQLTRHQQAATEPTLPFIGADKPSPPRQFIEVPIPDFSGLLIVAICLRSSVCPQGDFLQPSKRSDWYKHSSPW